MNRLLVSALILALAACSPAGDRSAENRATGNDETRTYPLKDFDRVSAQAGIELVLRQGPFAVEAASRNGDLGKLAIDVRGSELVISRESSLNIADSTRYTVTATAPSWIGIEALAGVKVEGEDLQLEILSVEATAGVSMELSGTCKEINIEATAGASVDAGDLKCAAAAANASAGSKVDIWASERARATASAGASIEVSGKPPAFEQQADISSTVRLD